MSPHAIPPLHYALDGYRCALSPAEDGSNGFLPSLPPLVLLPDPYYEPWESVIEDLPSHIKDRSIRSRVQELPILDVSRLRTVPEWRRAYVILSILAHGYIWGGDHASEVLPPSITVPLLRVSSRLELPPVATYASTCLWNFRTTSPADLTKVDSLGALHTFTGTEDESWFYTVSVAMEAQGAHIIPIMLRALKAVRRRDYATITHALEELATCIKRIHALLGRMYERCDPTVFYYQIRPFLAGSKNMASAGLPRGVFYNEGDGAGEWMQLRGGSNGQSSLIQFLDIVLGVEHTSTGNNSPDADVSKTGGEKKKELNFHEEVRAYMPAEHRQFLEDVGRMGSIRDLAELQGDAPEQENLRHAFKAATGALTEFRNKHLEIVTRYIIIPSRRKPVGGSVGLAGAAAGGKQCQEGKGELTGTGGTALLPFLKQVRDETAEAGRLGECP
ncbi:indoleamine 2,3-dioxygenase [Coniochaeta sp. 2T2.1]|nr:indoleamine 2,3-dioxygenase [Coniochaeta sp. 2T2.1]